MIDNAAQGSSPEEGPDEGSEGFLAEDLSAQSFGAGSAEQGKNLSMKVDSELALKLEELTKELKALAHEMAPVLKEQSGNPPGVKQKSDGSVVTDSDPYMEQRFGDICEKVLGEALVFLGEESEEEQAIDVEKVKNAELLAVCDPIDGTKNFVNGGKWFGCSLGVSRREGHLYHPVYGIVIEPLSMSMMYTKGSAAVEYHLETGEETVLRPAEFSAPPKKLRVAAYAKAQERFQSEAFSEHEISFEGQNASIADVLNVIRGEIEVAAVYGKWWDVSGIFALCAAADMPLIGIDDRKLHESFRLDDFVLRDDKRWFLAQRYLMAARGLESLVTKALSED